MISTILAAALVLQSAPTIRWTLLNDEHEDKIYYATEATAGLNPIVWFRVDLARPEQGIGTTVSRIEIDCAERRTRQGQTTAYAGPGTTGHSETWDGVEPWEYAVPDSNMDDVLIAVCRA